MPFTPKELEFINYAKGKGKTADEIAVGLDKFRVAQQEEKGRGGGFLKDLGGDIKETGQAIAGRFKEASAETGEDIASGVSPGRTLFRTLGRGAGAVARSVGDITIGAGKAVLPEAGEEAIKGGVEKVVASKPVRNIFFDEKGRPKKFVGGKVGEFLEKRPELTRDIKASLGFGELGLELTGLGVGAKAARTAGGVAAREAGRVTRELGEGLTRGVRVGGGLSGGSGGLAGRDLFSGLISKGGELAERVPRAVKQGREALRASAQRAERLKKSSPAVREAIKSDLDDRVINRVVSADQPTLRAQKRMVDIAEKGEEGVRPHIVAGKAAAEQFKLIEAARKTVGQNIGNAVRQLSKKGRVDITDTLGNLRRALEEIGVKFKGNKLVTDSFKGTNLPKAQRAKVKELWELTTEGGKKMSPLDIWRKDNLFSQLQREARFSDIGDIIIDTAEGGKENLFSLFRNTFRGKFDEISSVDIRAFNKQYRDLLAFQEDVESSILKTARNFDIKVDPAKSAQVNLRRIMSEAQSASTYQEVVDQLDVLARQLGYEGASPNDLIRFAEGLKRIYPDIIPPASFQGGIRTSVLDLAAKALQAGKPGIRDQQRALRNLVDSLLKEGGDVSGSAARSFDRVLKK